MQESNTLQNTQPQSVLPHATVATFETWLCGANGSERRIFFFIREANQKKEARKEGRKSEEDWKFYRLGSLNDQGND